VPLNRDGFVISSIGKNGGIRRGRSADQITLCDIYRSITGDKKILVGRSNVPLRCRISTNINDFFETIACEANTAMLGILERRTVADSLAEILELDKQRLVRQASCGFPSRKASQVVKRTR
jgi:Rrf2 family transcriptional regulator, repressor of oqxAB